MVACFERQCDDGERALNFVGIDGGTESVRVGIFDREGTRWAPRVTRTHIKHPRPGWAEQDRTSGGRLW